MNSDPQDENTEAEVAEVETQNEQAEAEAPEAQPEQPSAEEQISTLNDQLLRALAEIENTRRRAAREQAQALKYGAANFARDILSVADNLNRSLVALEKSATETPELTPLLEGIRATERELQAVLARHNIKIINPEGEKFDPNQHEALFEVPDDSKENGTIIEVVEVGYMLDDRLLRAAKVGITKK